MSMFPKTVLLLGSGELGKEVAIAAKRLGCKVIACDRYENAPAMQIADIAEKFDMTNPYALKQAVTKHKPDVVIPEIEALAVDTLIELEKEGFNIIPNATATAITMNRDKIRELAAKKLKLKTAKYKYASNQNELKNASKNLGYPVIIKPAMSSSGKGQSLVKEDREIEQAWKNAIKGARGTSNLVIVEEFLKFDLEITLLTIRQKDGTTIFCEPIGHEQSGGDYQCSWQPAKLTNQQLEEAQKMAQLVTNSLGGVGLFGVEFFITESEVIFSELSPRPHDTGLVTLISQNLNEFELHLRAILGLPIPTITHTFAASRVILSPENISNVAYQGIGEAMSIENSKILIFGKPNAKKGRRMGVALATGNNLKEARYKADKSADFVKVIERKNIE